MPNINMLLNTMKQSKFFSSFDLASGYHQIKIRESDIPITAFSTPTGLWEFLVLPFGITSGPASFARAVKTELNLNPDKADSFFDDILCGGMSFEQHLSNIEHVLQSLERVNLRLKAKKCTLFAKEISFLGHTISENGIKCMDEKIKAIQELPSPTTPKELRSYLGMMGYYRRFVKNFSIIARELHKLAVLGKNEFKWTTEAEEAFNTLKEKLTSSPILTVPNDNDKLILVTDSCKIGMGSVLTVDRPEGRKVVSYASHILEKSRTHYEATKLEMYAVVYYVQYHKFFLKPKPFVIETDHRCLQYLATFKDPPAIVARWISILSEYQYSITYKPNTNGIIRIADVLSRNPSSQHSNAPGKTELKHSTSNEIQGQENGGVCRYCIEVDLGNTDQIHETESQDTDQVGCRAVELEQENHGQNREVSGVNQEQPKDIHHKDHSQLVTVTFNPFVETKVFFYTCVRPITRFTNFCQAHVWQAHFPSSN